MSMVERFSASVPTRWTLRLLAGWAIGVIACTVPPPEEVVHRGPVVLITIDTLRADVVGALTREGQTPTLTPHLDRLAEEADWVSTAIAASSWTVPSMASIVTGKQPWSHGNLHGDLAVLSEEQRTLAEVFREQGYQTTGFRSNVWLRPRFGYAQGFDAYYDLGGRKRAVAVLESLGAPRSGPQVPADPAAAGSGGAEAEARTAAAPASSAGGSDFVWLHVLPPHAPYVLHEHHRERLGANAPENLPTRVSAADLETYLDPAIALPDDVRDRYWALYRLHTAHADAIVGELLDAIRRSGNWDETMIAVTSDHGEEFGEEGQIAHGGNLNRVLLEVPLIVKLPESLRSPAAPQLREERRAVSNVRLFATLAEAIGATPGAGTLPSLWQSTTQPQSLPSEGALSELYLGNGDNRYSLVEVPPTSIDSDSESLLQVHWTSRFGPDEPEYFLARQLADGELLPSGEPPSQLWQRQRRAFDTSLPLRGAAGRPEVEVRFWTSQEEPRTPQAADAATVRRLERTWRHWNGEEEPPLTLHGETSSTEFTPEEKRRLETLGYVVGG